MIAIIFMLALALGPPQDRSRPPVHSAATEQFQGIVDVPFCDLIASPAQYADQRVRVRAIYRYGFEWRDLYSLRCDSSANRHDVWLDFAQGFESQTRRSIRRKLGDHGFKGRTVGIVAVGTIRQGGYGHMGAYELEFRVERIEQAKILAQDSLSSNAISAQLRGRIEAFEAGKP